MRYISIISYPSLYLKCLNARFSKLLIMSSWPGWNGNCFKISISAKQKMNSTADSRRCSCNSMSKFDLLTIFSIRFKSLLISASESWRLCHASNVKSNEGKQCSATEPKADNSWSNCGSSPRCKSFAKFLSCSKLNNYIIVGQKTRETDKQKLASYIIYSYRSLQHDTLNLLFGLLCKISKQRSHHYLPRSQGAIRGWLHVNYTRSRCYARAALYAPWQQCMPVRWRGRRSDTI